MIFDYFDLLGFALIAAALIVAILAMFGIIP